MRITVIGRGRVGGGLAALWREAGHDVTSLGREGGDASGAEAVVVAVPAAAIPAALEAVGGLAGQVTLDACNIYTGSRAPGFLSLTHQIAATVGGPAAKAFSTNFAAAYGDTGKQPVPPHSLYAADAEARAVTERLIRDAGFAPLFVGALEPCARLIEDSAYLTRAVAEQVGPFFYRLTAAR